MKICLYVSFALYFASGISLVIQLALIMNKRVYEFSNRVRGNIFNLIPTLNYWIKVSPTEEIRKRVVFFKRSYILSLIFLTAFILCFILWLILK